SWKARFGDHAPGLRNRFDPAFAARGRAERRSVVEIAPPIPTSIPTILFESVLQRCRMGSPVRGACMLIAPLGQGRERRKRCVEEPAEPDALAFASRADSVHAVVPIPRADQRQAVFADGKTLVEPARAVLDERCT